MFTPTNDALAQLMRGIKVGSAPGSEALQAGYGLTDAGELGWVDWIFCEDGYHLSTVGQCFMSPVIYSAIYSVSPEGLEIGSGNYAVPDAFGDGEYPLEGISNDRYQEALAASGALGIYDLKGYLGLDYIHDDLRGYLQRLAWETLASFDRSPDIVAYFDRSLTAWLES